MTAPCLGGRPPPSPPQAHHGRTAAVLRARTIPGGLASSAPVPRTPPSSPPLPSSWPASCSRSATAAPSRPPTAGRLCRSRPCHPEFGLINPRRTALQTGKQAAQTRILPLRVRRPGRPCLPRLLRQEDRPGQASHPGPALPHQTPGRRPLRDAPGRNPLRTPTHPSDLRPACPPPKPMVGYGHEGREFRALGTHPSLARGRNRQQHRRHQDRQRPLQRTDQNRRARPVRTATRRLPRSPRSNTRTLEPRRQTHLPGSSSPRHLCGLDLRIRGRRHSGGWLTHAPPPPGAPQQLGQRDGCTPRHGLHRIVVGAGTAFVCRPGRPARRHEGEGKGGAGARHGCTRWRAHATAAGLLAPGRCCGPCPMPGGAEDSRIVSAGTGRTGRMAAADRRCRRMCSTSPSHGSRKARGTGRYGSRRPGPVLLTRLKGGRGLCGCGPLRHRACPGRPACRPPAHRCPRLRCGPVAPAVMATVILTVGPAFTGYLATYLNGLRLAQRQAGSPVSASS